MLIGDRLYHPPGRSATKAGRASGQAKGSAGAGSSLRIELIVDIVVSPLEPDQELMLIERLWSGAVTVSGLRGGQAVGGAGRVDLSGYAGADDA